VRRVSIQTRRQDPQGLLSEPAGSPACTPEIWRPCVLTWGRREGESGALPVGGWARHESVLAGKWDRFFPKPVRLDIEAFMEKDNQGKSHWYPLTASNAIQALVARMDGEQRVYVVTITPTLPDQAAIHSRWPRIVPASSLG